MITLAKWSVAEYHKMIAAGILSDRSVELLAGDIVEIIPESTLHASIIRKVANYLRSILTNKALISEAHPITLSDSEPEPDLAIIKLPESRYDQHHPQVEDIFWLIEIADASLNKDLNNKQKIYAAAEINEYWVMDINKNLLTVFRQPQGESYPLKYSLKNEMNTGNISPLSFPEIIVSVNQLFS